MGREVHPPPGQDPARRRDGPGKDRSGHRGDGVAQERWRGEVPRGLPRERARELVQGGQEAQQAPRDEGTRTQLPHSLRRLDQDRRRRRHHLRDHRKAETRRRLHLWPRRGGRGALHQEPRGGTLEEHPEAPQERQQGPPHDGHRAREQGRRDADLNRLSSPGHREARQAPRLHVRRAAIQGRGRPRLLPPQEGGRAHGAPGAHRERGVVHPRRGREGSIRARRPQEVDHGVAPGLVERRQPRGGLLQGKAPARDHRQRRRRQQEGPRLHVLPQHRLRHRKPTGRQVRRHDQRLRPSREEAGDRRGV